MSDLQRKPSTLEIEIFNRVMSELPNKPVVFTNTIIAKKGKGMSTMGVESAKRMNDLYWKNVNKKYKPRSLPRGWNK